jgi:HD-GYP domain-containing protein (c-di-GMP phosphodiesterase class II)
MRKVDRLLSAAEGLGPAAQSVVRDVAAHYELELAAMTSHMGQMYEELMFLYNLGDEIAATMDTATIADRAVDRICELLDARQAVVMLTAGEADDPRAAQGVGTQVVGPETATLVDWATRQAVARDRGLILNEFADQATPVAPGVSCLLASPLRARGKTIGVVHVINKDGAAGFSTEDQMLLQAVGTQLAAAIENARLFTREQDNARHLAAALDELGSTYDDTLEALSGALDLRDNETEGHARRVTRFSVRIAEHLGLRGGELVDIERGALLHDIGKIGVPDAILLKPTKLTDEEWEVMKRHPVLGHSMIRNIRFLAGGAPVVLHHHERYDGKGYPAGLQKTDIPLGARVFAVADTFDAMTSDRPYRKALDYDTARSEIERCLGSQFDPSVVAAFAEVWSEEWDEIRAQVETQLANRRRAPAAA